MAAAATGEELDSYGLRAFKPETRIVAACAGERVLREQAPP